VAGGKWRNAGCRVSGVGLGMGVGVCPDPGGRDIPSEVRGASRPKGPGYVRGETASEDGAGVGGRAISGRLWMGAGHPRPGPPFSRWPTIKARWHELVPGVAERCGRR
jgi:hypothetical protein